jgi:arsenate reductase (thioredoxin)
MRDHSPMRIPKLAACAALILTSATIAAPPPDKSDVGPFVRALWLVQRRGTPEAADPRHDLATKGSLSKALGKEYVLKPAGVKGLMGPSMFAKLAGPDGQLDPNEVRSELEADVPNSRRRLLPKVASHADILTTSFDQIDELHREAGQALADWIVKNYKPGRPLHVSVICTGNSRRSILGATMGNIAAAYYGLPEIRFHSGGTAPSAFNPRTIAALREIGVEVEPTGEQAPRGEPSTANPVYRVRWGQPGGPSDPALEATEFSKTYFDRSNPQDGFAALMVCSEADEGCPFVKGASLRISMPYLDPKIYDGGAYEPLKYAERRDDMGRLMLSVLMQASRKLASK